MLSRFAPDGIVPEEFKLPSFNHVWLQRKDTKMYQVIFFIVTYHIFLFFATFRTNSLPDLQIDTTISITLILFLPSPAFSKQSFVYFGIFDDFCKISILISASLSAHKASAQPRSDFSHNNQPYNQKHSVRNNPIQT